MKTTKKEKIILEFRIGKWDDNGKYHQNGGGLRFWGDTDGIASTAAFDNDCFAPKYKNGNINTRTKDAEWTNCDGNGTGLTNACVKSGIGRINLDNSFDTTYTVYLDENLSDEEILCVFNYGNSYREDLLEFYTESELEWAGCRFTEAE